MAHIQNCIADGDLTHEIEAEGRSEMGQLAAGLKTMQQSLIQKLSARCAITQTYLYWRRRNFRRQQRPLPVPNSRPGAGGDRRQAWNS